MHAPPPCIDEPARLASLHRLEILDTPAEERFDRITRLARAMFDVPIALVSIVDTQRQWFKSRQGLEVAETSRDISFCGHAVAADALLVVCDTLLDPRFADNPLVHSAPQIRFYAGQVLRGPEGHAIGTLCIIDRRPRELSAVQLQALRDLAALAEQELAVLALAAQWRAQRERSHFFEEFLENALEMVHSVGPGGRIEYVNRRWREVLGYATAPAPSSIFDVIAEDQRGHCEALFADVMAGQELTGVETVFITRTGDRIPVRGSIGRHFHAGHVYTKGVFRDATSEAEIRERLIANAMNDPLTGLPNRRALMDRLAEATASALRHGRPLSLAMLDLDAFKAVNDTYGHLAGDRVLQRLAASLTGLLRKSDLLARYGGEEFCILLPETEAAQAVEIVDRLRTSFKATGDADTTAPPATFSAGVAQLDPHRPGAAELIGAADKALYAAKRAGRDRVLLAGS